MEDKEEEEEEEVEEKEMDEDIQQVGPGEKEEACVWPKKQ